MSERYEHVAAAECDLGMGRFDTDGRPTDGPDGDLGIVIGDPNATALVVYGSPVDLLNFASRIHTLVLDDDGVA